MCGLAGCIDDEIDQDRLIRAAQELRHRGPDDSSVWLQGSIGLAHTRLSIIDRAHGAQPMFSDDGRYGVVFNGEIYNHGEIRSDLAHQGYRFRTHCDTEVLLALYETQGTKMVTSLRGMFSFAIVDTLRDEVFLARDRFGKKPLYFSIEPAGVAFASTLDSLLRLAHRSPSLDAQAISEYLVLQYMPSRSTPWSGIEKLEPGTWLKWNRDEVERRVYWSPPLPSEGTDLRREDAAIELRQRIREAVDVRLESEVPLGVFLSGGLDSSVVVAAMSELGLRPRTFSVGFEQSNLDERPFARSVATRFNTEHLELVPETDVLDLFSVMVSKYDEPFADSSALATLAVAQAAKEHVTVVLTGDGGDELFGGYDRYRAFALATAGHRLCGALAPGISRIGRTVARELGSRRAEAMSSALEDPWASYRDHLFHFTPGEARKLISADAGLLDPGAAVARLDEAWGTARRRGRGWVPWVDSLTYLPDDLLTKMDRATMAFGIESRAPLLDQELWSFVAGMPRSWLLGRRRGKLLLREAYTGVLPDQILTRTKKGFGVPIAQWMRSYLRDPLGDLLQSSAGPVGGLLDPSAVRKIVDRFVGGDDGMTNRTWNLLALAGWCEARHGGFGHG